MTGYRRLKPSDPREAELRDAWHKANGGSDPIVMRRAEEALTTYLWKRACAEREADRQKHPKAKRNQVFQGSQGEGRMLP